MKLRIELINYFADQLVKGLVEKDLIETGDEYDEVIQSVAAVIIDDLQVEDELNSEVKEILENIGEQMDDANVNYHKMFKMVKLKLVRERGLIL